MLSIMTSCREIKYINFHKCLDLWLISVKNNGFKDVCRKKEVDVPGRRQVKKAAGEHHPDSKDPVEYAFVEDSKNPLGNLGMAVSEEVPEYGRYACSSSINGVKVESGEVNRLLSRSE